MAYISPNSTIRIMKNVPLPESGIYSVWWNDESEQEAYFAGKTAYTLNEYTYTRKERNVVKVGLTIDQVYGCNYMAFKNTSYENKWFYAFITDAEYINDGCTALHFRIDDMQTWWNELKHSTLFGMVKRCHSSTDEIGDNTVPEDISLSGDYIQIGNKELETIAGESLSDLVCVLAIADASKAEQIAVHTYDKIFSASQLYAFTEEGKETMLEIIKNYIEDPDSIVCLYMAPKLMTGGYYAPNTALGAIPDISRIIRYVEDDPIKGTEAFGINGFYVPQNKKLYTYPYNYYCISNGENSLTLRYEWFADLTPEFLLTGNITFPASLSIQPTKYGLQGVNGYGRYDGRSHTESLTLNNYPQCSFACDSYANWAANNIPQGIINTVAQVGSAAIMTATGNGIGGAITAANAVTNIANGISAMDQASRSADIVCGTTNPNAQITGGNYCFWGARMAVDEDTAQMIDYYFTKYGYMQHKLMTINPDCRPSFYHVETEQFSLNKPEIPAEAQQNICNRFDNGITFWKDPDQIGAFNLDNKV